MTDVLPGLMTAGSAVQEEIAKVAGSLACVLTENTVIRKMKGDLCFEESVCNGITLLCPDCDSDVNKTGNVYLFTAVHTSCKGL